MKEKAFFSIILVFYAIFFLLAFQSLAFSKMQNFENSLKTALELEQLSLQRSIIEQNTDFLIEKTLENNALLQEPTSESIVKSVNSALETYFQELKAQKVSFFETDFFSKNYSKLSDSNAIAFSAFSNHFKANVVKINRAFIIDLEYAGTLSGARIVFAKLKAQTQELFFLIPLHYSIRKVVLA